MPAPVDSALLGIPSSATKGSRISWVMAVVGCLYFLWLGVGFIRAIPIFSKLYEGLGVALPVLTRMLLSSHFWLLPIVWISAAILSIAKKFVEFSPRQLRIVDIGLIFVGAVLPALIVVVLYLPLFVLIEQLKAAH
jgi:hypothetical protein